MTSVAPAPAGPAVATARTDGPARPARPRRPGVARRRRHALLAVAFLAPSAIPLALFVYTPMVRAGWISLHDWNLISPMRWVGLENFRTVLADPDTRGAFWHTFQYVGGYLPLVLVGGLALALALNRPLRARGLLRGVYFLPVVTSWIAVALVWRWLLNPTNGAVNAVLGFFGIDGPGWWSDPTWAMPSVILASAWKDVGYIMVILLAGLQTIPAEVVEAATLDGAGPWRRLWSITLPLLSPSLFFVLVTSLISGLQVFDQVYAMTEGGPAGASEVVVQQVYDLTFRYGHAGQGAALSWLLFVVILLVTVVQLRGQRKWVQGA